MGLRFFHVPCRDSGSAEAELNSFLAQHRVVTVERRFVENGTDSFWALCVDFLNAEPRTGSAHGAPGRAERKVDYREVLTAEQFAAFARLRDLRKSLAEREAVPVYAIFTNEQLAAMVKGDVDSHAKLRAIEGVGDAKMEKYAEAFLAILSENRSK